MNLRISSDQLRFRITQSELSLLMEGSVLSMSINLGAKVCGYQVAIDESIEGLALAVKGDSWRLNAGRKMMEQFAASIPNREGVDEEIEVGGKKLTLVLEVDVSRKA